MPEPVVAGEARAERATLLRLRDPASVDRLARVGLVFCALAPLFLLVGMWMADRSQTLSEIMTAAGLEGVALMCLLPGLVPTALAAYGYRRFDAPTRTRVRAMPAALIVWTVIAMLFGLFVLDVASSLVDWLPSDPTGLVPALFSVPLVLSAAGWIAVLVGRLTKAARPDEHRHGPVVTWWGVSLAFEVLAPWWVSGVPDSAVRLALGGLIGITLCVLVVNVAIGVRLAGAGTGPRPLPRWATLVNQFALQPLILVVIIGWMAFALAFSAAA